MKNKIYEDVHRGQERNARKTENFNKETENTKKRKPQTIIMELRIQELT